jgi:hypothetical protein
LFFNGPVFSKKEDFWKIFLQGSYVKLCLVVVAILDF